MKALINKYSFENTADLEEALLEEIDRNQNKKAIKLRMKLNNRHNNKQRRLVA